MSVDLLFSCVMEGNIKDAAITCNLKIILGSYSIKDFMENGFPPSMALKESFITRRWAKFQVFMSSQSSTSITLLLSKLPVRFKLSNSLHSEKLSAAEKLALILINATIIYLQDDPVATFLHLQSGKQTCSNAPFAKAQFFDEAHSHHS